MRPDPGRADLSPAASSLQPRPERGGAAGRGPVNTTEDGGRLRGASLHLLVAVFAVVCVFVLARQDGAIQVRMVYQAAAVLGPLAVGLLLCWSPAAAAARTRWSPECAAIGAVLAGAGYLAGMAAWFARPLAEPLTTFAFATVLLSAPFAVTWLGPRACREACTVCWPDLLTALLFLGLAGSRWARLLVDIGYRNGRPFGVDASLFVWLDLLIVYVVLVRRLDVGCELTASARDWKVLAVGCAVLLVLLWPLGATSGLVAWRPTWKPLEETVYAAFRQLFRVALGEEILFRLLLQTALVRWAVGRWGERPGCWLGLGGAALVFGLAHFSRGPAFVLLAFLAGAGYGWAYQATGRLAAPWLLHVAINLAAYSLTA
ncbi:MAG: CPBP family intramembrane metalloprotease [Candidatus Riflebacteria bacterium]|nr:CPBP family intramembrane metalloprotease [Candidatus Riflebacteria bacterium]